MKSKEITSRHNAKFKLWFSLLESKGIKKDRLCLVGGAKLIDELVRQGAERIVEFILPPKGSAPAQDWPATRLTGELFNELDISGTKSPLAVVRTLELPKWVPGDSKGLQLVLALSDPNNLGALLRSCEAFKARRIILTTECCSPFLPRAIRSSAGSVFRLPLNVGPSLASLDVTDGLGLHMEGENLLEFKWPENATLILGEEGRGLPEHLHLRRIRIPMAKNIDSLNATVAASIALYSYRSQYPI